MYEFYRYDSTSIAVTKKYKTSRRQLKYLLHNKKLMIFIPNEDCCNINFQHCREGKTVLEDLGIIINEPMRLFCDNKEAISIANDPVQHDRMVHIEIVRHFYQGKVN